MEDISFTKMIQSNCGDNCCHKIKSYIWKLENAYKFAVWNQMGLEKKKGRIKREI